MKKVVEYRVVNQTSVSELRTQVNHCLGDGWELYGSPYTAQHIYENGTSSIDYLQAMTYSSN
jgi:hypothetical protein